MINQQYPSRLLENAVSEFSKLPGVGRKTALRLVLHLLREEPGQTDSFAAALSDLRHNVKHCSVCHNISDTDVCPICANPHRDEALVCVVENIQDVLAIENTQQYNGLYHVLGGVISPMDGIGPNENRKKMINTHWGGVLEDNSFGTHEFMELCRQLD